MSVATHPIQETIPPEGERDRITVYLEPDVGDRLRSEATRRPRRTLSRIVEDALRERYKLPSSN